MIHTIREIPLVAYPENDFSEEDVVHRDEMFHHFSHFKRLRRSEASSIYNLQKPPTTPRKTCSEESSILKIPRASERSPQSSTTRLRAAGNLRDLPQYIADGPWVKTLHTALGYGTSSTMLLFFCK